MQALRVDRPRAVHNAPSARRGLVVCAAQAAAAARINVQGKHLEVSFQGTFMLLGSEVGHLALTDVLLHLQVTAPINEYVQKKVSHAIDPYKTVVQDVDVRLSVRGGDASRGERCAHHL